MSEWRTIPVFISSTFVDMQAERDVLVKRVFPALRARLEKHRVRVVEIDLRWGLTEDQRVSTGVLELCLREVQRSQPYFIGLLGERYGSLAGAVSARVRKDYPWLPPTADSTSLSELEMLHGVLNSPVPNRRALFYLRDPRPLSAVSAAVRSLFIDEDADTVNWQPAPPAEQLAQIEAKLRRSGVAQPDTVLGAWLQGRFPPVETQQLFSPAERLAVLKERARRSAVVRMDGYSWRFEGIRIRWNLARLAIGDTRLVDRLSAAAHEDILPAGECERIAHDPDLGDFVRNYGSVVLRDLESFAEQVEADLWSQLKDDERITRSAQRIPGTAENPARAEQPNQRELISWIRHFLRGKLPAELAVLSPDDANTLLEQMLTRPGPFGSMLREATELWQQRCGPSGGSPMSGGSHWAAQRDEHERFAENRLHLYVRRGKAQRAIRDYLRAPAGRILLVQGAAGAGKSALLAHTARLCGRFTNRTGGATIAHFVGATATSSTLRDLLRRLSAELRIFEDEADAEDIARDINDFAAHFAKSLGAPPVTRPIFLIIDALDQLDPTDTPEDLRWLPPALPAHVRVVISVATDQDAGRAAHIMSALSLRHNAIVPIDSPEHALSDNDRRTIIDRVPSIVAKSLEPEHIAAILRNEATRNPLYLKVALEELRSFGTRTLLGARIAEFERAPTPTQLFVQIIKGLSLDFDPTLVREVLVALASARRGLSESEITAIAASDPPAPQPRRAWLTDETQALLRHLRPNLIWRGETLDFLHRCLRSAVTEAFLPTEPERKAVHARLGRFFESVGRSVTPAWSGGARGITEALYHHLAGAEWNAAVGLLNDDAFVFHKTRSPWHRELAGEWAQLLALAPPSHAVCAAISLSRLTSQQTGMADVARDVLAGAARLDQQRFTFLAASFRQKGILWREELRKAQVFLIGLELYDAAEVTFRAVEDAYDPDEDASQEKSGDCHNRAVMLNSRGRHSEALVSAQQSVEFAKLMDPRGGEFQLLLAIEVLILCLSSLGRTAEAATHTRELFDKARGVPVSRRILPRAILNGFEALVAVGTVDEAEGLMREGLAECAQHQDADYDYASLAILSSNHFLTRNRFGEAVDVLRTALQSPDRAYPDELRAKLFHHLSLCLAKTNQTAEAREILAIAASRPWSRNARQLLEESLAKLAGAGQRNEPGEATVLNQRARTLEDHGELDAAETLYKRGSEQFPNDVVLLGNHAFFRQNSRRDFPGAHDLYLRALKADPTDTINHTNYAGLCLVMGNHAEAEQHLCEAWRFIAGKPDRFTARTLFLRATLAALQNENGALYLSQLKTLFEQGVQPMPSRSISVRDHLQHRLPTDQFALFDAIYAAINTPDGLAKLSGHSAWQSLAPVSLDARWPEPNT